MHNGEGAGRDEPGHLYLNWGEKLGRVHSQDMALALTLIENGSLPAPQASDLNALQQRFAYRLSPEAEHAV